MKAYIVSSRWDENGSVCVIADSINEAKAMAHKDERMADGDYIDLRVKTCTAGDLDGLGRGVMEDNLDALRRGLCSALYDYTCPYCNMPQTTVYYRDGRFSCTYCEYAEVCAGQFERQRKRNVRLGIIGAVMAVLCFALAAYFAWNG